MRWPCVPRVPNEPVCSCVSPLYRSHYRAYSSEGGTHPSFSRRGGLASVARERESD